MAADPIPIVDLPALFKTLDVQAKFDRYRELWHQAARYEILTSFPLHLDIELCGLCNLRCEHCFQNGLIEKPLGIMDWELFTRIIDEGAPKGLCALKLQVRGESFLAPHLFDCIRYAKKHGIVDVQITTNATLLNERTIPLVIDSGLDALIVSVDSHHYNSYQIRAANADSTRVENAIRMLLTARKEQGRSRPWVRIQSSIPESDHASFNAAEARLKTLFPDADVFIISRIHDFREDVDCYPDLQQNYHLKPCSYLMHRLTIYWDGSCTTCCSDYNNRFALGGATTQSIEEIWHSPKLNGFRAAHLTGWRGEMPICRHCPACVQLKSDAAAINTKPYHHADYD